LQNGVLPVVLDAAVVASLAQSVQDSQGAGRVTVDLVDGIVVGPSGDRHPFTIEARWRSALLEGLDEVGITLRRRPEIAAFQARDRLQRPWIYVEGTVA
jgi:3-isopropylmalate/(R)-2-methylmalate dehydratase small subunit